VTGAAGFLYGISPTSGSVIEGGPAAVFSTYGPGGYSHWFVKFHTVGPEKQKVSLPFVPGE